MCTVERFDTDTQRWHYDVPPMPTPLSDAGVGRSGTPEGGGSRTDRTGVAMGVSRSRAPADPSADRPLARRGWPPQRRCPCGAASTSSAAPATAASSRRRSSTPAIGAAPRAEGMPQPTHPLTHLLADVGEGHAPPPTDSVVHWSGSLHDFGTSSPWVLWQPLTRAPLNPPSRLWSPHPRASPPPQCGFRAPVRLAGSGRGTGSGG